MQGSPLQIGKRVRAKRVALGLTQKDLAGGMSITRQHISNIEHQLKTPSLETLVELSGALGVSTDYLLTGRQVAPLDAAGAIRAQQGISAAAKKHLIGLLAELRQPGNGS